MNKQNIRRRLNYLKKHYDSDLEIDFESIKNKRQLTSASNKIKKELKKKQKDKELKNYNRIHNTNYKRIPIKKKETKKSPRATGLLNKKDFENKRNEFLNNLREYNKGKKRSQGGERLTFYPRNKEELVKAEKALDFAKKGEFDKVNKIFNYRGKKSVHSVSLMRDELLSKKSNEMTYHEYILHENILEAAESTNIPELVSMFRDGGISLIKEMSEAGFVIFDFMYDVREDDEPVEKLLARMKITAKKLSKTNSKLVNQYINLIGNVYEY